MYFGALHPSIKWRLAPSSTIIKVCSNCPDSGEFSLKYDWSGISTFTPFGTYTKDPPDHTAPCNATNLWSFTGTHFIKCSFTKSGYFFTAVSISVYITPCFIRSSFILWYTTSESYCAPTPDKDFFSASGIPNLSNVFFISSGTSSQELLKPVFGFTYVAISFILSSDISGPQVGRSNLLYVSKAFNLNALIQSGSFFWLDISSIISGVKPFFILKSNLSSFFMS